VASCHRLLARVKEENRRDFFFLSSLGEDSKAILGRTDRDHAT
jgi:hypothetical protein